MGAEGIIAISDKVKMAQYFDVFHFPNQIETPSLRVSKLIL